MKLLRFLLWLACVLKFSQAQTLDKADFPYREMAEISRRYSNLKLSDFVTLHTLMQGQPKVGTSQEPPAFVIHARAGNVLVPFAADGCFVIPQRQDWKDENPRLSIQGLTPPYAFSIAARFEKPRTEGPVEIRYSEIFRPYTFGAETQEKLRKKDPSIPPAKSITGQWLQLHVEEGDLTEIRMKTPAGDQVFKADINGRILIPMSPIWLAENPHLLFPAARVEMGNFVFDPINIPSPQP